MCHHYNYYNYSLLVFILIYIYWCYQVNNCTNATCVRKLTYKTASQTLKLLYFITNNNNNNNNNNTNNPIFNALYVCITTEALNSCVKYRVGELRQILALQGLRNSYSQTVPVHSVAFFAQMNVIISEDLSQKPPQCFQYLTETDDWKTDCKVELIQIPYVLHLPGMAATGWCRHKARVEKWVQPGWWFLMKCLMGDRSLVLSSHSHLSVGKQYKIANLE